MLEILIYLGLLAFCAAQPALRELARNIALPYRIVSASLVLLLVAGQLAGNGAATFPFLPWDMYTRKAPANPVANTPESLRAATRLGSTPWRMPTPSGCTGP